MHEKNGKFDPVQFLMFNLITFAYDYYLYRIWLVFGPNNLDNLVNV